MAKKKKREPKPQTTEELAIALNQNYQRLLQSQGNIQAINEEIARRHIAKETADGGNPKD